MTTLYINPSDSECGACGKSASPREDAHITRLGLGEERTGCGAKWTAVSSHYYGLPERFANNSLSFFDNLNGLPVLDFSGKVIGIIGGNHDTGNDVESSTGLG